MNEIIFVGLLIYNIYLPDTFSLTVFEIQGSKNLKKHPHP